MGGRSGSEIEEEGFDGFGGGVEGEAAGTLAGGGIAWVYSLAVEFGVATDEVEPKAAAGGGEVGLGGGEAWRRCGSATARTLDAC